ncbi:light-harvesting complex-like protein OHP1, chloroplastic [Cicer arietinum]|uniref:Light-harvesting complex-like protein OHP1, chloroplastic n=1 Tax=Cicer arietinum TaxID=3827 RepID=A0A1S2XNT0_CICAR|nr:light-harvesting complex-like protein OHP1, chloroplastic [Cicer arietinum]
MATSSTKLPSSFILGTPSLHSTNNKLLFLQNHTLNTSALHKKRLSFTVQAVKPPSGVEFPKVEPKFKPPFLGFTKTAEIWNSRASMIGLIGVFIVELIINKGILEVIGVEIGKGLNIPL